MKRTLFLAVLMAGAFVLPSAAKAGTVNFTTPVLDSYVNAVPSQVLFSFDGPHNGAPTCTIVKLNVDNTTQGCTGLGAQSIGINGNIDSWVWDTTSIPGFSPLTDGVYTFAATGHFAIGGDNNGYVTFTIDTIDPTVTIQTTPPVNGFTTSAPSIDFDVDDLNEGITPSSTQCSLDGGPFANCTSPFSTSLADGGHTLQVQHTDKAGNQNWDDVSFIVDTTPPTINLVGLGNGTVVTTPYPQYSLETPGASSMQCFYDNNPSLTCQSISISPTGLPDGAHTMHIIATDAAGNVATLVVSFTVDDSLAPPDQAPLPTGPRPTKVNLKKTRSVVSGSKVKTTFSGSFTIRGGGVDWNNACTGRVTVKFTGKVNGRTKSYSKRASLKRKGSSCTFKGTASLPRAWKGKRVKTTVSHAGNAGIGKFAVSGGFRP